ncbi:MAG: hypothetical protein ACK553_02705 [Planctomycetota bacterium]|jgi:predicted nucleotidyltransferase
MLNKNFRDMLSAFNDAKVEIDGLQVPVIGLEELLKNKESSGRDKDIADIPTIQRLLGKAKKSP